MILALVLSGMIASTVCGTAQSTTPSYEVWVMTRGAATDENPQGIESFDAVLSTTPTLMLLDPIVDTAIIWWNPVTMNQDGSKQDGPCPVRQ